MSVSEFANKISGWGPSSVPTSQHNSVKDPVLWSADDVTATGVAVDGPCPESLCWWGAES